MTAVLIACGLAVFLLLYAATLLVKERRLRRRLVPIAARILDPGRQGAISASDQSWAAMQSWSRDTAIREGRDPDTNLPSTPQPDFTAVWEFELDGRTYRGTGRSTEPVFSQEQAQAKRAQIWYDRADPRVSVVRPGAADAAWAWFIAAGIVAAFALIFLVFASFDATIDG